MLLRFHPALVLLGATLAFGAADPPKTRAILINGGGSASSNYLSHFHHLQDMAGALKDRGIETSSIDVFSADGDDPKSDLVVRGGTVDGAWLIGGTALGVVLDPTESTNTVWEGVKLHPASMGELRRWFAKTGRDLKAGDTLLVFVTDHGRKNADDPDNGFISLWNESLSVLEFRALLAHLRPGVRVVNVMSQCYSGAFADAMSPLDGSAPTGDVCGFYSTTREREAFGCYPEGRDKDRVGYAFHFIDSMSRHPSLDDAQADVVLDDGTPDVPLRTSDVFLRGLLLDAAEREGAGLDATIDEQLVLAWQHRARWEPEIRLLDRLGDVYGTFSPRMLKELDPKIDELNALSKELDVYEERWKLSFDEVRRENLDRFLEATPAWKDKTDPKSLNALTAAQKKSMLVELIPALDEFTRKRGEAWQRLSDIRAKFEDAGTARYRVDIRLAALARMGMILTRVAGLQLLDAGVDPESKAAFARLDACERSPLGALDEKVQKAAAPSVVEKLAPFEKDRETVRRVLPSWLGIDFRPIPDADLARLKVQRGSVVVSRVYPDSAASAAGLRPGDFILGPPDAHFDEPNRIREWTMNSPRGVPLPLEIRRADTTQKLAVSLSEFPTKIPVLPAPPKEGDAAPPLVALKTVRAAPDEDPTAAGGQKHMLFFWATWCGPCKSSLPELVQWSEKSGVPVLAVSDEDPDTIKKFLEGWTGPFPLRVASDDLRTSHIAYGVSGTPTFVLVDEQGKIAWRQVGYSKSEGLTGLK